MISCAIASISSFRFARASADRVPPSPSPLKSACAAMVKSSNSVGIVKFSPVCVSNRVTSTAQPRLCFDPSVSGLATYVRNSGGVTSQNFCVTENGRYASNTRIPTVFKLVSFSVHLTLDSAAAGPAKRSPYRVDRRPGPHGGGRMGPACRRRGTRWAEGRAAPAGARAGLRLGTRGRGSGRSPDLLPLRSCRPARGPARRTIPLRGGVPAGPRAAVGSRPE